MSLIVIPARHSRLYPITGGLSKGREHTAKTLDTAEHLWRQADLGQKAALQLTGAQSEFLRQHRNVQGASGALYSGNSFTDYKIAPARTIRAQCECCFDAIASGPCNGSWSPRERLGERSSTGVKSRLSS